MYRDIEILQTGETICKKNKHSGENLFLLDKLVGLCNIEYLIDMYAPTKIILKLLLKIKNLN